ncbi:MAG: hypothetical protein JXA78_09075 [Anaerolineales bacterium]|nr:hypothetical protein [Anaerolineales bacterium]
MLALLAEGPAETTGYLVAGYVVIFGMMLLYLVSLALRRRNLEQDLESLKEPDKGEPER